MVGMAQDDTVGVGVGVQPFDPSVEQDAQVVRLVSPQDQGDVDVDSLKEMLAEQEAESVSMSPIGGASHDPEVKAQFESAKNSLVKSAEMDLLDSEYDTMLDLVTELYARIDIGRMPGTDLMHYEVTTGEVRLGFIDYEAEEYLYVGATGLVASRSGDALTETASYLGIAPQVFVDMLRDPGGRAWLFSGEDPSQWGVSGPGDQSEEAVLEEIEELAGMWDTPEVVDEASLPSAEGRFGVRGDDGKWRPS
jgi:hypothetical protein